MSYSGELGARGNCGAAFMLAAGGPQPSSYNLSWAGPFTPGDAFFANRAAQAVHVDHAGLTTVSLAEMAAIAASDPDWWVIV